MGTHRRRRTKGGDDEEPVIRAPLPVSSDAPVAAAATDRLLQEAGPDPAGIAAQLQPADPGARVRALTRLQQARGNGFVQDVVDAMGPRRVAGHQVAHGSGAGHASTVTLESRATAPPSPVSVQREGESPEAAEELQAAAAGTGATEQIGPEVESSWQVAASSLADAAAVIEGRPEAGQVGWSVDMQFTATKGPIDSVAITATISLEMPEWTPPPTMLPKAKAEWARWYAALRAHEQGHIDLVHAHMDGLAKKLLGKSPTDGQTAFANAKAALSKASKAYDKRTDHGRNAGTIMDTSIEQQEIDEKRKADEAAKKAAGEKREGAVPPTTDATGDG